MASTCTILQTAIKVLGRPVRLAAIGVVSGLLLNPGLSLAENQQVTSLTVASGEFRTPVVELYTSEGCSSCPRADNWISKLGTSINHSFNAVPLAFHVDYWNYLGWEDPFSSASFTARQRELGALNGQNGIYTPEFLVSGRETRGTTAVVKAITKANTEPAIVHIEMTLVPGAEDNIEVALTVDNQQTDAQLYLAVYENNIVRQIEGGENRGRTLKHDFVVRYWQQVANLQQGKHQLSQQLALNDDWQRENLGIAVVAVGRRDGQTLQAVRQDIGALYVTGKLATLN